MATYHNITASEMSTFLGVREFHPIYPDGTAELVFAKPIHPGLTLRVYTGINPNGQSRAVGNSCVYLSRATNCRCLQESAIDGGMVFQNADNLNELKDQIDFDLNDPNNSRILGICNTVIRQRRKA